MANKHVKKHLTPSLTRETYTGSENSLTRIGMSEVREQLGGCVELYLNNCLAVLYEIKKPTPL